MATVIIGLGNPVRRDDSLGLRAAEELGWRCKRAGADVAAVQLCGGGLRLMEAMAGYDRAIVIDAIVSGGTAGDAYRFGLEELPVSRSLNNSHDMSLADALEFGRALGVPLPDDIAIWAVEAGDVSSIGEDLTPEVERGLHRVVEEIWSEIRGHLAGS